MLKELMKNTIQLTIPEIIEYDFQWMNHSF